MSCLLTAQEIARSAHEIGEYVDLRADEDTVDKSNTSSRL
jgi:hypothetical protein